MVLEIALGITALFTAKSIGKNVIHNRRLTKVLDKKDRRELLWRYGPFKLDDYVVKQLLPDQSNKPSIPLDPIKWPKQAA